MVSFKFLHAIDESLNAFHGESIVEGSAETTNGTVTLDTHHALRGSEVEEFAFEFLVFGFHDEANVHDRAVLGVGDSSFKHL